MATIFNSEQELLDSLKRSGWQIVGKNPHLIDQTSLDVNGNTLHTRVPDGNVVWSIIGPDGDPDEVVVGVNNATGGPGANYPTFTVVEGPKKAIPNAPAAKADWQTNAKWIDQPDGSKRFQAFNPTTQRYEDVAGVAAVPASDKDKPAPKTLEQNGTVYERQDDGSWVPAKGIPTAPTKVAAPTTATINKQTMQWDPQSNTWITPPGAQATAGPKAGDTTPGVREGYLVQLRFDGEKWDIDPSVKPTPWSAEAQAQAEKVAAQPKEGDTRPNISGGYNVTQTYKGGEWTTTAVGSRATPRDIQTLTPSTEAPFIIQTDENGQPVSIPNPNYQGPKAPTTRGELAQRVALLQQQAATMKDKIAADKTIPPDQQTARFLQWYDQNITPQVGAMEQQQQAIIADETQKAVEAQQKNLTAAANAIQSTAPYRVGPGYGKALGDIISGTLTDAGLPAPDLSNALTWKGPSIDRSTQDVLNARTTVAPGMDFQSLLNRNQWTPGGPPPAAGGPPGPAGPPAPTPEQQAAVAAAGAQTAAATQNPANSPFGAIGPNPMLAAIQRRNRALASQQTAAATAQAGSPFGALNAMPRAGAMPMASDSGPLPYNPSAFSGVMPLLPGFDYSQLQTQWQPY